MTAPTPDPFDDLLPLDKALLTPDPPPTPTIVAMLTEQRVHMGDHAQDVTRAVTVDPNETVAAMAERVLTTRRWVPGGDVPDGPDGDKYLTLRLAVER